MIEIIARIIKHIIEPFLKKDKEINIEKIENAEKENNIKERKYKKKEFLTKTELNFYNKLKDIENIGEYKIQPQINLSTIIEKESDIKYRNELFRNIDFGVFSKDYSKLYLLIELNDETHNNKNRQYRDIRVKEICNEANIKLITFYTRYPNEKEYIINRIIEEIKKD